MTEWISVKDIPAPKQGKFLFYYYCGIGLGSWGQAYTYINGNSERTHHIYFLVLWPMDLSENDGIHFEWNDDKMLEMDVYWMPLPKPPDDKLNKIPCENGCFRKGFMGDGKEDECECDVCGSIIRKVKDLN